METKFKIAVIDDDKMYLSLISKKIQKMEISKNVEIRTYETGKDFLSDDFTPNVLVLDYHLNGAKYKNGLQVMSQVRRTMKKTMVYMISGEKSEDLILDVLHHGAMDFLSKDSSLMSKLVDHLKFEYSVFKKDLKVLNTREVKSKLFMGLTLFGIAPIMAYLAKPELVPFYVAMSLLSFVAYAVKYNLTEDLEV